MLVNDFYALSTVIWTIKLIKGRFMQFDISCLIDTQSTSYSCRRRNIYHNQCYLLADIIHSIMTSLIRLLKNHDIRLLEIL